MLKLTHISKTFNPGTVNAKKAIEDLSFHAAKGDFITVIGANGAGKSTLFNAISGSFFTDSGKIELDGKDITFMPEYKRARSIGRLFQDPMRGSAPGMTIEENLALAAGHGGWLSSISRKDRQAFRERLSLLGMGLEGRMTQPVGLLSGGQRQALTLMMATYNPPKLLLLDEHTAALDPATAEKVLEITKNTVEENHLTCMMITHNMQSALELGNRTIMMNAGKIILDVTGEERAHMTVADLLDRFKRRYGFERKDRRARREGGRFRDYQSGHEPGGGALVHCAPCAGHPRLRDTDGGGSLHAHGARFCEAVPGGGCGRRENAEGPRRPLRQYEIHAHRRYQRAERGGVPCAAERAVLRRQLDGAGGAPGRRRF